MQVGTGKKMAYCLLDSEQDAGYTGPGPVRDSAQYSCTNQGISIGWLVRSWRGRVAPCCRLSLTSLFY